MASGMVKVQGKGERAPQESMRAPDLVSAGDPWDSLVPLGSGLTRQGAEFGFMAERHSLKANHVEDKWQGWKKMGRAPQDSMKAPDLVSAGVSWASLVSLWPDSAWSGRQFAQYRHRGGCTDS